MTDTAAKEQPEIPTNGAPANAPGLILPPPEIRELIEKTAPFIARNGPAFEEKIREKGKKHKRCIERLQLTNYRKIQPKVLFSQPLRRISQVLCFAITGVPLW